MDNVKSKLIWVSLFAACMGIFEGAVVIYLREIYYPGGFDFPLVTMSKQLVLTEIIREFASLLMLISVAWIAGKSFTHKFALFLYSFALWDIVYYIFLWFILKWPESIFTWDILFLIPVMWTGPVITPIIISAIMIMLAIVLHKASLKSGFQFTVNKNEWWLLLCGALIVFLSFIWDYCKFIISYSGKVSLTKLKLLDISESYTPSHFNWILFFSGVVVLLVAVYLISNRQNTRSFKDQFLDYINDSVL